jgi:hypothetical protein
MLSSRAGRTLFTAIILVCITAAALAQVPSAKHVVLVIDENSSYSHVVANMPWLISKGKAYGYATKYQSDNGGSLLDYLWLASGSCHSSANCTLPSGTHDFNCNGNDCYYPGTASTDPITDNNIFRVLNNAGISWKVYAQSYAAAGGTPTTPDNHNGTAYYRRHNGATWYSDILSNVSGSAGKIVDLAQLATDLKNGALPRFTIIVPDGNHDAHDCPVGMSSCTEAQKLAAADQFLSNNLGPILNTADFQSGGTGLALVTFDECGGGTNAGCGASVYTALIGPKVKAHTISSIPYKHENSLRTILDSLGVKSYPGAAANAADMSDFFGTAVSKPEIFVSSPFGGASLTSPVTIEASATPSAGHSITGWWVYVDSVGSYNAGAVTSIAPKLKMATGTHTIVVRAWDTSGGYGDQTVSLTVANLKPTVAVLTPTNNAVVGSPVNLKALASPTAGQSIGAWWIYVDGVAKYNAGAVTSINAELSMGIGKHTVVVRSWDTSTAYGDQTLTLTVGAKPAVAVSTPWTASNVTSPVKIQASASPSAGHSISKWSVYVDGVAKYNAGAVTSISPGISAAIGMHTILVRSWDTSGAYGDQTFTVDVRPVAVNIGNILSGASVISPATLGAGAKSPYPIAAWHIYVDSVNSFTQNYGSSVNTNLTMGPGTHTVVVRAWDTTGAYGDDTVKVTIP